MVVTDNFLSLHDDSSISTFNGLFNVFYLLHDKGLSWCGLGAGDTFPSRQMQEEEERMWLDWTTTEIPGTVACHVWFVSYRMKFLYVFKVRWNRDLISEQCLLVLSQHEIATLLFRKAADL